MLTGEITIGGVPFHLDIDGSSLSTASTPIGTVYSLVNSGTLTGHSQQYTATIGLNYVPNTDNYQVSVNVTNPDAQATLVFGKLFLTPDVSSAMRQQSSSSNVTASTAVTPMTTTSAGTGTFTYLGRGSVNQVGSDTLSGPGVVVIAEEKPYGNDAWLQSQVYGTTQAVNDLSGYYGAAGSAWVNDVRFAVSNTGGFPFRLGSMQPAPSSGLQSLSQWSWVLDPFPGWVSSAWNALANLGIWTPVTAEVNTNSQQQIHWGNINQNFLVSTPNVPTNTQSYTEAFDAGVTLPTMHYACNVDGQVVYGLNFSGGFTNYYTTPWVYVNVTT